MKFHTSKLSAAAAASVLVLASGMANAAVNLVTNGSFEDGSFNTLSDSGYVNVKAVTVGSTVITGWTVINKNLIWIDNAAPASPLKTDPTSATAGTKFLDLTAFGNVGTYSGVVQAINTTVGTTYNLEFKVGNTNDPSLNLAPAIVFSAAGLDVSFGVKPTPGVVSSWTTFTYSFKALAAATPITFLGIAGGDYIGLDDIKVMAAVPEPSSMVMLFAGLAAVGSVVARRRKEA